MRNFAALHDAACPEPPQLPAELWAYIFQQLTMKDWACAASTCRALWAVQPYPAGMCRICLDDTCWPGMQKGADSMAPRLLSVLRATGPTYY